REGMTEPEDSDRAPGDRCDGAGRSAPRGEGCREHRRSPGGHGERGPQRSRSARRRSEEDDRRRSEGGSTVAAQGDPERAKEQARNQGAIEPCRGTVLGVAEAVEE